MSADKGRLAKRSVVIAGHRTSVSLEQAFWDVLGEIARERGISVQACIAAIDQDRGAFNLSSAIRVHVLAAVLERARREAGQPPGGASGF